MNFKFNAKNSALTLFVLTVLSMGGALLFFADDVQSHRSAMLSDVINDAVREEMDRQNEEAMALSIAIAGNELLADALKREDRKRAAKLIDNIQLSFENSGGRENFWLQLHTKDLKVFMRSWDKSEYGTSLESFRKGLVYVKETQKPFSSIELGKKLNFKAIAPIRLGNEYVGSLEVIKNFDESVKNFKDKKIALFVLMDNKFLDVAEWMSDYPFLGDFVICHKEYDKAVYDELKNEDIYLFIGKKKIYTKNYFICTEPMRDFRGERLGFFLSAIPKKLAKGLQNSEEAALLFNTKETNLALAYKNRALKQSEEDIKKIADREELYKKINNLTREELEGLLLYGSEVQNKRGEIR